MYAVSLLTYWPFWLQAAIAATALDTVVCRIAGEQEGDAPDSA